MILSKKQKLRIVDYFDMLVEFSNSVPFEMRGVDVHSSRITLKALQAELSANPMRLEELKEWGNTPLMSSAEFGNVVVCKFLLSIGANIEAKNVVGYSLF